MTRSREEVHYRPARRERSCGNCVHFSPTSFTCTEVEGRIEPRMVCDLWVPLKRSHLGSPVAPDESADSGT